MPDPRIIDPSALENLRALGSDDNGAFLREIVGIFLADMPERIAELEQGLSSGERERFIRSAHSIKGSAANLGATALRAAAERLESEASRGQWSALAPRLAELIGEFVRARAELEPLLAV